MQCIELPNITDSYVIEAFLTGTSYRDLVSNMDRWTPTKASKLMDISTKFALGQEAIESIFNKDKGNKKRKVDALKATTECNHKKNKKKKAS